MTDIGDSLGTVGDSLTNKVGPLPVWAWAGMAAAGVSAAILIRRRMTRGTVEGEPAEPAPVEDGYTGSPTPFLPGGFVVGGGPAQATGSTYDDEPATPARPKTNSDWQIDAQRFLIGRGYQGTIVTDALARFLSGRALTAQGAAVIDAAIAGVGAPPQPVPPPTVSPTPEPLPSPGGGGATPKPPATPKPRRLYRYDWPGNGPDGPGSFVVVVELTDGSLRWVRDGNEYSRLADVDRVPESKVSATTFAKVLADRKRVGPAPRWLPPGARW